MTPDAVWDVLKNAAQQLGLDPFLVGAIAMHESSWNPLAARFEGGWEYFVNVQVSSYRAGVPYNQEREEQATSWGLMQVMGSVARELGFKGVLSGLSDPQLGAKYGTLKLAALLKRWPVKTDAIAAYNAGSPRPNEGGPYGNQDYVDKVLGFEAELRSARS